jgi:S-adenosylmethionine:tRNA ribosyltransferase-isomerase
MEPGNIAISAYNYELPADRIADFPLAERDQSRLLVYKAGAISDHSFHDLPDQLPEGATLILNNTRVIEARVLFQKPTGGLIEIFCLEPFEQTIEEALAASLKVQWQCLIGGASKWKNSQLLEKQIVMEHSTVTLTAKYIRKETGSFIIEFSWQAPYSFAEVLHAAGAIPLPPYIRRKATAEDSERYQTIFGSREGSVAAPTAALHFTPAVFQNLSAKKISTEYITLHVGAGTFKPVKTETIGAHAMHREPFTITRDVISRILASTEIIAVGTTSLRTLETLHWLGIKLMDGQANEGWELGQWEAYELEKKYPGISFRESLNALLAWMEKNHRSALNCQTSLMIVPGYLFKIPTALVTNFHQPQSTLLLLVSAFIGEDWKKVYAHALQNNYRFLSYGDSSLLWRKG